MVQVHNILWKMWTIRKLLHHHELIYTQPKKRGHISLYQNNQRYHNTKRTKYPLSIIQLFSDHTVDVTPLIIPSLIKNGIKMFKFFFLKEGLRCLSYSLLIIGVEVEIC